MAELPDNVLDILLRNQELLMYKKGEVILRQGINAQGVYYVRKGKIRNFSVGYEGREYTFYISGERELIGHHSLISDEPNAYSAATLENSQIIFIPKQDFLSAMEHSAEFQQTVMKNLSHEFAVFVHMTKILAQYNVREKTALALLIANEKYLTGGSLDAVIELPREVLASMVGTVKENLVRILREFKDEGIISTKGHGIVIRDFDALIRLSKYFD
jgi:CRP-like cAMP-binding protein